MRMDAHTVIVRPLLTEKGVRKQTENNIYGFEVNVKATKKAVKAAVEELFDVHVVNVRTMTRKGKPRVVRYKRCRTPEWKKALVKIREGESIDLF